MWRLYLTNAWLMLMTILALPYLLVMFWSKNNTSFLMYVYALLAQKISGIKMRVTGRESILAEPAVYVFNHQSSLDGIPLGILRIPRVAIIGKKEIVYIPFIGWTFWLAGNVLLNRGDGRKARGQLDAGIEAIKKRRVSIAIFPEGARNRDVEGFLPFKRGGFSMAIEAGVPVVPVVIQSFRHVYNKRERTMKKGTVQVSILPAISTTGLNARDGQALAQSTEFQMKEEYAKISNSK